MAYAWLSDSAGDDNVVQEVLKSIVNSELGFIELEASYIRLARISPWATVWWGCCRLETEVNSWLSRRVKQNSTDESIYNRKP